MNITKARWIELERDGGQLTPEEFASGWHYCWDWDGLLIGPGCPEIECCTCTSAGDDEMARSE